MTGFSASERYPLKTIEKKWRTHWEVNTPFSLDETIVNSARIEHFDSIRPLIYADIAAKRGKNPQKIDISPLFNAVYQDKSGNYVSLDDIFDEKQVKKGKPTAFSVEKKNIIENDLVLSAYGIDACRLFLVSDNPPNLPLAYEEDAIEGAWRFINLYWQKSVDILSSDKTGKHIHNDMVAETDALYDALEVHKAIAKCREAFKTIETRGDLKILSTLFFPVIPHITSEILARIAGTD